MTSKGSFTVVLEEIILSSKKSSFAVKIVQNNMKVKTPKVNFATKRQLTHMKNFLSRRPQSNSKFVGSAKQQKYATIFV